VQQSTSAPALKPADVLCCTGFSWPVGWGFGCPWPSAPFFSSGFCFNMRKYKIVTLFANIAKSTFYLAKRWWNPIVIKNNKKFLFYCFPSNLLFRNHYCYMEYVILLTFFYPWLLKHGQILILIFFLNGSTFFTEKFSLCNNFSGLWTSVIILKLHERFLVCDIDKKN
jgi:hypothetical protein